MTQATVTLGEVGRFTDKHLIARLRDLVRTDQQLGAHLLVHLGEVDARGLYREQAYPSMFAYCVKELHMSEGQAYMRIQAARLGRQFPLVVELFERGALHLSAIKLLAPHLTADNHVQVLERASFRGKREIELLVAELAPKPDVPNRMRKLPEGSRTPTTRPSATSTLFLDANTARSGSDASVAALLITQPSGATRALNASGASIAGASVMQPFDACPVPSALDACVPASPILEDQVNQAPVGLAERIAAPNIAAGPAPFALEPQRPRGSSVPLRPGRYKVELTAGQALHDKLEQLQELLRHRVPDGDLAAIVELAVDALIDKTMKQRCAQTQAPKKPRSSDHAANPRKVSSRNSRYVPRAVVREVYARDEGRCTFVSSAGKRCSERGFLELHHHDVPFGRGGEATPDNLRLACRAHNALFAERDYGVRFMQFKQLHARASKATKSLVPGRVQV
jgi:hypothetical protein